MNTRWQSCINVPQLKPVYFFCFHNIKMVFNVTAGVCKLIIFTGPSALSHFLSLYVCSVWTFLCLRIIQSKNVSQMPAKALKATRELQNKQWNKMQAHYIFPTYRWPSVVIIVILCVFCGIFKNASFLNMLYLYFRFVSAYSSEGKYIYFFQYVWS